MTRRRIVALVIGAVVLLPAGWFAWAWATYPSDKTPQGAYLRVMSAVNRGQPEAFFAYVETPAQHACYTIARYRKQARERVLQAYPEPERTRLANAYAAEAAAPDGADVFAIYARRLGWLDRLRRDMSGIAKVEIEGERATVETARGTRYPFRRRDNGIWGLTLFTATLVNEAQKAARDAAVIEQAAGDYERVKKQPKRDAGAP
ncbi:MAG: hypothetical protein KC776_11310 [Myxococcales bacterium]|nr:hypothetical protein [Myxococcales bacterium]MCB9578905.1 hypothetical protein [Polyangiaceae bacterium]